jgi:hypothetical protein
MGKVGETLLVELRRGSARSHPQSDQRAPASWSLVWPMALALACFAVSCHSQADQDDNPEIVVDRNGEGALVYAPGGGFGVDKTIVGTGEPWSAGGVTLCKKRQSQLVTLDSVRPVTVRGQVRLDGIGARTTHYAKPNGRSDPDTHLLGTMPGRPAGLQSPEGFRVETTCPNTRAPVGEIVVTLTKVGPEGGSLDDLRILYTADGRKHELTLGFHFGLCGSGRFAVPCTTGR